MGNIFTRSRLIDYVPFSLLTNPVFWGILLISIQLLFMGLSNVASISDYIVSISINSIFVTTIWCVYNKNNCDAVAYGIIALIIIITIMSIIYYWNKDIISLENIQKYIPN